ncbi:BTAD domain-containing putative transcriptional regulator [Streptomyces fractus]|uniref:AfsR/SARP family transcriptional regulator n=1 Tax=Streptomyces fractus TaxID=641806 RepID=UPI003CEF3DF3
MDSRSPRPLRIEVLGPLRAWRGETPLRLGPAKQQAVLSALLLGQDAVCSHERLLDAVWGAQPPADGSKVLPTHVNSLRRALDPEGARPSESVIRSGTGWYRFAVEEVGLDTTDLEGQSSEAMRAFASGDLTTAADQLSRAIGIFRGEPLSGLPGPFAREERQRWMERRRTLQVEWLRCLVLLGRYEEALDGLGVASPASDGYDERLTVLHMRALYGCGRQGEALRAFEDMRVRLRDELGTHPGEELRRVHEAVLRQDDTVLIGLPAPVPPRHSGVPAELPLDTAGFVGRTEELAQLHALLPPEPGQGDTVPRSVVISAIGGAAGIGKTALAVHWAHQVRDRFPDGQLYVNLHGFDHDRRPLEPREALELLLRSLGLTATEIPSLPEAQGRILRTLLADRHVLVLLDNAASPEQVRPLLPGSPTCCVIVTSRNRLGDLVAHDGAHALALGLLRGTEARTLLGRAVDSERDSTDGAAVSELIHLCGRLPLALRVASAQLAGDPGLRPADLVAEMAEGHRLAALEPDSDANTPLRTAFSVSYRVLAPAARRLFRLLGLFPGAEFTAESAAALGDMPLTQARRLLSTLTEAHLIEPTTVGRYQFHDLLREYAQECARAEEPAADRDAALERLLLWYLHAVRAVAGTWLFPELPPGLGRHGHPCLPSPAVATPWLEAERGNLLACIDHAAHHGPRPVAWHMVNALFGYFFAQLPRAAWQAAAQTALDAAVSEADPFGQAAMHISLGLIQADWGNPALALDHHSRALHISRELGWATGEAAAIGGQGQAEWNMAQLEKAQLHVTTGTRIAREAGNPYLEVLGSVVIGLACRDMGRLHEAAEQLELAIRLGTQIKGWDNSLALQNLGWVYWELGRPTDGLALLVPEVTASESEGNHHAHAAVLDAVAKNNIALGRHSEALTQAEHAYALAKDKGRRWTQASILNTMATAHRELKQLDQAAQAGTQALSVARQGKYTRPEADSLLGLSLTFRDMSLGNEARVHAEQALALARACSFRVVEGQVLTSLCGIAASEESAATAIELGRQALTIHRETGHRPGEALTLQALAQAAHLKTEIG